MRAFSCVAAAVCLHPRAACCWERLWQRLWLASGCVASACRLWLRAGCCSHLRLRLLAGAHRSDVRPGRRQRGAGWRRQPADGWQWQRLRRAVLQRWPDNGRGRRPHQRRAGARIVFASILCRFCVVLASILCRFCVVFAAILCRFRCQICVNLLPGSAASSACYFASVPCCCSFWASPPVCTGLGFRALGFGAPLAHRR